MYRDFVVFEDTIVPPEKRIGGGRLDVHSRVLPCARLAVGVLLLGKTSLRKGWRVDDMFLVGCGLGGMR